MSSRRLSFCLIGQRKGKQNTLAKDNNDCLRLTMLHPLGLDHLPLNKTKVWLTRRKGQWLSGRQPTVSTIFSSSKFGTFYMLNEALLSSNNNSSLQLLLFYLNLVPTTHYLLFVKFQLAFNTQQYSIDLSQLY